MAKIIRTFREDKPAFVGMLTNVVGTLTGMITGFLIPMFLSATEQGAIAVLRNIVGVCGYVELGSGAVIMRQVAYRFTNGETKGLAELASLLRVALCLGFGIAGVAALAMAVATPLYLFQLDGFAHDMSWLWPWGIAASASATPMLFAVLEQYCFGAQRVTAVYMGRIVRNLIAFIAFSFALVAGWSIWAFSAQTLAGCVAMLLCMIFFHGKFLRTIARTQASPAITWRETVWPQQWRYGISTVTGLIFFMSAVPIIASLSGLTQVAQWSFSFALANSLTSLANTVVVSQEPKWCQLASTGRLLELRNAVRQTAIKAGAFSLLALVSCLVILPVAQFYIPDFSQKSMAHGFTFLLVVIQLQIHVFNAIMVSFVRSFGVEPFATVAWVSALVGVASMYILTGKHGAVGCLFGYWFAHSVGSIGVACIFWRKYKGVFA